MLSIATGELIKSANGIFCRTINTIKGIASHASRKISINREAYFFCLFNMFDIQGTKIKLSPDDLAIPPFKDHFNNSKDKE
jgi:hypothetical protein